MSIAGIKCLSLLGTVVTTQTWLELGAQYVFSEAIYSSALGIMCVTRGFRSKASKPVWKSDASTAQAPPPTPSSHDPTYISQQARYTAAHYSYLH